MNYTRKLTFVLTSREKTALAALASEDSSSQASVLRRLIRCAAQERDLWVSNQEGDKRRGAESKEAGQ